MASRRLNLTIPEHFDDLLGELAELSGRSKASYVLDALKYALPHWQRDLRHLRAATSGAASVGVVESVSSSPAIRPGDGVPASSSPALTRSREMPDGLNRQQRRAWLKRNREG